MCVEIMECVGLQAQLSSVMEVLCQAAVTEVCKLVEEGYTLLRVQLTHAHRENKALRRKIQQLTTGRHTGVCVGELDQQVWNNREDAQCPGRHQLTNVQAPECVIIKQEKQEETLSCCESLEVKQSLTSSCGVRDTGVSACPLNISGLEVSVQEDRGQATPQDTLSSHLEHVKAELTFDPALEPAPIQQPLWDEDTFVPPTHAARTTREKLFICTVCGKAFNRPKKVEIHLRVHTGEKPFRCGVCGKWFAESGNLKKHQRVHTGEKPFSCTQCGRRFAWIRNLKTHQQRNHT